MKWKNNLFLLAMLVIVPAVSWLFLRNGVDYRLESLEQLEMEIPAKELFSVSDSVILEDHVTIIAIDGDMGLLNKLFDQFKDAPGFQMISNKMIAEINSKRNFFVKPIIDLTVFNSVDSIDKVKYFLIDGNSNLRSVYCNKDESKEMVRHIATILPYVEKKVKKNEQ